MKEFYVKKSVDGEDKFVEAVDSDLESLFSNRFKRYAENKTHDLKTAVEKDFRENEFPTIESKIREGVKGEFQSKIDELTKSLDESKVQVSRKTIAAEYGFKPEFEKYLGNGTEEEMRKEADVLKAGFGGDRKNTDMKKTTGNGGSESFITLNAK